MKMKSNILMGRYELGCLLGRGTFAKVYYAKSLKTGESVAIKIMDKQNILKLGRIEQIKREISVMRLVQHPNIVRLYEVMASKSKIYIVMEYVKGGELFKRVANKGKLKEEEARKYFQQLISAVDFCHSQGVYHRDLKLENLLLDENWILKVTDFGLSALPEQHRQDGLLHTACGTPAYVSPEIINRKGYDGAKADIWSCGVILFVLMAGYLPFQGANLMVMYKKIYKGDYKCPPWFSSEVRRLMFRLLDPEPQTRITVAQLMEVPWFRRGFKHPKSHNDLHAGLLDDIDSAFCSPKPARLNAFDIISRSLFFSLSGLFNDNAMEEEESRFTSIQSAPTIMSKLEEAAKIFGFSFNKSKEFKAQLQRFEQVRKRKRKGHLCIDAEIFEVTSSVFLVEFRKIAGDTVQYSEFLNQELRPRLKDIISA